MNIYIHKIFLHDITHEVSITKTVVSEFFNDEPCVNIIKDNKNFAVLINDATDPRLGGCFKGLYRDEDVAVGDFLVIKKLDGNNYSLLVVKSGNPIFMRIASVFNTSSERHFMCSEEYFNNLISQ